MNLKIGDKVVIPGTAENLEVLRDYGFVNGTASDFVDIPMTVDELGKHETLFVTDGWFIPRGVTYELVKPPFLARVKAFFRRSA